MADSGASRPNLSRRVLVRLLVVAVLAGLALAASVGFITDFYLENQLTPIGLTINGGIVLLFVLGLASVVWNLLRYSGEETALREVGERLQLDSHRPVEDIARERLITRRYEEVVELARRHAQINHGALAATLQARESTRLSFPRFIHNILILTGVFGTIVSLSIALVGASNLLDTVGEVGNMGLVVHGMSTALSTTITAIVCYLFYGYFFIKLSDVQTQVLSGIEEITTLYLVPRYARTTDTLGGEITGLLEAIRAATETLHQTQASYDESARRLLETVVRLGPDLTDLRGDVEQIKAILREGFRLPQRGPGE
jgi:hypothetical protein